MDVYKCWEKERERKRVGRLSKQMREREWKRERGSARMQQSSGGEEREARRTRRYGRSFTSCMRDARTAAERLPFLSFFLSFISFLSHWTLLPLVCLRGNKSIKIDHYLSLLLATCSTFFCVMLFTALVAHFSVCIVGNFGALTFALESKKKE